MDRLNRMLAGATGMGGLGAAPGTDNQNLIDNSETVYISSLALLKMLRHGRAGVPMEVMGLMLGEFVDDFTVRVVDVFAMPQSGTGVSVEAVDPVFQQKMMDMLTQTGRPESVVGWYHSHPGFGCWLSSVDINTQQSFEQLTPRAVAVVVDPIQSVKGKVVIDAFRLINPQSLMLGQEPRQSTSNLGHLNKPSIQALIHGLNRHYYSIGINYRKTALEENMLMNLHKHVWTEALEMEDFRHEGERNKDHFKRLVTLAEGYEKRVKEETELTKDQLKTRYVGKLDPKKHLEDVGQQLIEDNIVSVSRQMIDKEATMPKKDAASNGQANGDHMDEDEELLRANLGWPERNSVPGTANRPQSQSHEPHHTAGPATLTAPGQTQPHPRIRSKGRFPTTPNSKVEWSTSNISPEQLKELFNLIHETLEHVPYAICGLGALIDHGFTGRKASRISILCPQESKDNVKAWAASRGCEIYADSVGLSMRDGSTRRVRIKYIEFGFEGLQRVRSSFSNAIVLSLVSQLDNVAAGYLDNRKRGDRRALKIIADDVFFCLDTIASRRQRVDPRFLPTLLGEDFFPDFTAQYVDARPEMARAGIDVSSVLAKHRTATSLREHNEMLREYGMEGDVIPQTPGQFEHIRDLNNSQSVYTLRERDPHVVIPPMTPLPESSHQCDGEIPHPNRKSHPSARKLKVPARTSGPADLGRNLTAPQTPKAVNRPVADWI
ncbi:hypothetical protein E0Z10_g5485 [Xylaria hypoxylon]|uniref:MPN domain-containing protein n=1 Tax=Xylaria hypoxylon TaxID=37992 RepID=A0A4Z0YVT0_9PEZI|nr:hypothetical protein E0Z10_g5485 [Xylaria hypoxylon]